MHISRLFDIVTKDGVPTLVPGHLHSRPACSEANASGERPKTTTTRSGRTIRKPTNSSSYSQKNDEGNARHLASNYEKKNVKNSPVLCRGNGPDSMGL